MIDLLLINLGLLLLLLSIVYSIIITEYYFTFQVYFLNPESPPPIR